MPLTEPTRLVLTKTYVGTDDPDAAAYITAVEAADTAAGQSGGLETAVKVAIHSFVKGCKADGIWPAIKASCILAGTRTLNGALVPLVGAAPTNYNFVAGDYNRKTGLVGDGSTKYLDSNRNNNADPQNNNHNAAFVSTLGSGPILVVVNVQTTGANLLGGSGSFRSRSLTSALTTPTAGFWAHSRSSSSSFSYRINGATASANTVSDVPQNSDIAILRSDTFYGTHRLAFYSIGESLDLALLDARVTDLINAFGAAIP